jgi:hypothetical protein
VQQQGRQESHIHWLDTDWQAAVWHCRRDNEEVRISLAFGKGLADTRIRVSIEAGGNAPFIVFDDADINAAVEGVIASKFRGTGQTCVCANRIFVQAGVHDEFASRLADKVSKFVTGNGLDSKTSAVFCCCCSDTR